MSNKYLRDTRIEDVYENMAMLHFLIHYPLIVA